ncbi:MAG: ribosome-associated translation inhibitor RaiA [Hyphomonadaceae bacterium]
MRVQIAGRHVELGEALKARITEDLERSVEKYFSRSGEAVVTVARDGAGFGVDCSLHLASGIALQAEGRGGDAHAAFSDALEKIEKRVRRYKRRLKNHHNTQKSPLPAEIASAYVLQAAQDDDQDLDAADDSFVNGANGADSGARAPLVIAETKVAVRTMAVSMAVLQLELSDGPALLFRNAAHGGLNLVYRRGDGNVGWVDPERADGVGVRH